MRGGGRGPRRLVAGVLSVAFTTGAWCLVAPSARAADDYPWAWQGQCPILPQEPIEPEPVPTATPTPSPGAPAGGAGGPGEPAPSTPPPPPPPPPPPVLDPVSGHLYDPRGPRPTCERGVWFIDGSMGDQWGFALRNCTSFVAWRLNRTNDMPFENRPGTDDDSGKDVHWGDAHHWDDTARSLGYRVDRVPAIGAVAQTDAGRVGHVAWVVGIGPGTVTVEEYNHAVLGGYGTRTVPVDTFRYLHLRDIAPSPQIGSDRPLVAAQDETGDSWTARVDDSGTLRVAKPRSRARVVGDRGSFSPLAAPTLVLDQHGRPWIAATTRSGSVLAGTRGRRGWALSRAGASAPTSSPALSVREQGRVTLVATSAAGTLAASQRRPDGRWSRPRRIGRPGSWATHTAPVTDTDESGRTWLVAMSERGRLFVQHTLRDRRRGWSRLRALPGARASVTSTPSLTRDGDGVLHLHQTGYDGVVAVRSLAGDRWSRPERLAGEWSPYSSPAVREMAGELQLAAVTPGGRLLVRPALPGSRSTLVEVEPRTADPTRSPALVTRSNFGVFVVSTDGRRQAATLVLRPASAATGEQGPTRAGIAP